MHTPGIYILKRLLQSIPLILFVMAINFLIIHAAPGDPITYLYGSSAEVSAEQMHRLREELGLTQPLYIQSLLSKLAGIRSGDQVIYWEIGRDQGGAEIRLPGSAVPISQDPAPPARR